MQPHDHDETAPNGRQYAPWERTFTRILTPFEEFIHRQTTTGLVLMGTTVLALLLANSPLAEAYHHLVETYASIGIGSWKLELSVHHWVNDGLMALFFFVVGLELKRELLVGELSKPRQAALPIAAAIGGMAVPALLYFLLNHGGDTAAGWGIPMATDIAFAIGVMVLLAARVPQALITFLVALAIVDDLGAVVVIALFYTADIAMQWLLAAACCVLVLCTFNLSGVRKPLPYFLVSLLLWYALLQSGVHATLAGVIGAFTVPTRPKYDPAAFSSSMRALLNRFDASHRANPDMLRNSELVAVVQTMENGVNSVQPPLQQLEHQWHLPVALLVIPVFALANAGIPLNGETISAALMHPVSLGIMLGLVAGKAIGITLASWLALKLGIGQLPAGTRFSQIVGVSLLAGIGFTMAIFIAELAFAGRPEALLMAKMGVLLASLFAGMLGTLWLLWCGRTLDIQ